MASVRLEGLTTIFYPSSGGEVRALDNITLSVVKGELLAVVGPSGSGKTTLLRVIAGLESPTSGTLWFEDQAARDLPPEKRDVAMVFQHQALYPHLSVWENLAFGLRVRGAARAEIESRVRSALTALDLENYARRRPVELSGGQRQRVALGRALVRQPGAFLLDEPLAHLDSPTRIQLRALIRSLQLKLGATMICVTHDESDAIAMADRIAVLQDGRLERIGKAVDFNRHSTPTMVTEILGPSATNSSPQPPADVSTRLSEVRHIALDLDGTIYRGRTVYPAARPFLGLLSDLNIGHTFVTNNPTRSHAGYIEYLGALGIATQPAQLLTSTQVTIRFLQSNWPQIRRLFALGTPDMAGEFAAAGFELVDDASSLEPDAVVVGFDPTLTYRRLCRAAWWISRNKAWFATNPDRVCPTDEPTVWVDCGSLCAALRAATNREPDAVLGKPDPAMLRAILDRHGLQSSQLAMVGDRLYTDMAMAKHSGALGVLVLTGETSEAEARAQSPPPDLIIRDLAELGTLLSKSREHGVK